MASRIILLDRNAVDAVKRCVSGVHLEDGKRQQLKKLDRYRNFISPILSAIEGQSGRRETEEEIKATLTKEARAVGRFFSRARTDSEYFLSEDNANNFSSVFGNHIEHSWGNYISFLKSVFPLLFQPVSRSRLISVEGELFDLAHRNNVQYSHPVFIVSLATLYGHRGAQRVLKAKSAYDTEEELDRAAYNAVSDLIVISRMGNIKAAIPNDNKGFDTVRLFTFDKGLLSVINEMTIDSVKSLAGGGVSVDCTYSQKLFPSLDDSEFQGLIARLGKNS